MKSPETRAREKGAPWFKSPVEKGQRKAVQLRVPAMLTWGKKLIFLDNVYCYRCEGGTPETSRLSGLNRES